MNPLTTEITLIGNDSSLAYLLGRFAEQSGYQLTALQGTPTAEEIWARKPCLVLFSSIDNLESAQTLVSALADREIPVGVCASLSDEARAHELGADQCLVHPLTYNEFVAVFLGSDPAHVSGQKQDEP